MSSLYDGVTIPVTGVSLNLTTTTLNINGTVQLSATIVPANATNKNVTWTTNNASIVTASQTGVITAVGMGTATVTITTADGAKTATCSVTVSNVVAVTGVTLTPSNVALVRGTTAQLTATILPASATDKNLVWSTNNASVATISTSGLVTGVAAGTAIITVTT